MTAPEPTPLERAAEAVHRRDALHAAQENGGEPVTWADLGESFRHAYRSDADATLAAALAGDWLERVLAGHKERVLINEPGRGILGGWNVHCTCKWSGVDHGDGLAHTAHQAAAVVAYATGVGL